MPVACTRLADEDRDPPEYRYEYDLYRFPEAGLAYAARSDTDTPGGPLPLGASTDARLPSARAMPAYSPESPSAYVDALLAEVGDRDPLDVLALGPAALRGATDGLSDDGARRPERPAKWSVLHIARHLADSEIVSGYRLRLVVAHDRPPVSGYDQDLFADRLHYLDGTLAEALGDFEALRGVNLRFLQRLSERDLARIGLHSERGEESAGRLVALMAGHDLVHLRQIARVRRALGV